MGRFPALGNPETCLSAMTVADGDHNGFLNATEFYQLVYILDQKDGCATTSNSSSTPNDVDTPSLTSEQWDMFQGLSCSSCIANHDGGLFCCSRSLQDSRISIAGASDEQPSVIQEGSLNFICSSLTLHLQKGNDHNETSNCTNSDGDDGAPTLEVETAECFRDLVAADIDDNGFLYLAEFGDFLVWRIGDDDCLAGKNWTSDPAILDAFQGIACSSCLANADGGLDCCSRTLQESRISVAGAARANRTVVQEGSLRITCSTVEARILRDVRATCEAGSTTTTPQPAPQVVTRDPTASPVVAEKQTEAPTVAPVAQNTPASVPGTILNESTSGTWYRPWGLGVAEAILVMVALCSAR